MNEKPHWETKHDWHTEDFTFYLEEIHEFKLMLRRHPDDSLGEAIRSCIKALKKELETQCVLYKKVYGDRPNLRKLRREVENA